MLIKVAAPGSYEILGESVDDAAGEAFDKTAKLLGLPYPGGPKLEALANEPHADSSAYHFPRPMIDRPNLDFSFAGLKTAVLNAVHKSTDLEADKASIARCFEDAVADTLYHKCQKALDKTKMNTLVVAGGVSANSAIREALTSLMAQRKGQVFFARKEFCTDLKQASAAHWRSMCSHAGLCPASSLYRAATGPQHVSKVLATLGSNTCNGSLGQPARWANRRVGSTGPLGQPGLATRIFTDSRTAFCPAATTACDVRSTPRGQDFNSWSKY